MRRSDFRSAYGDRSSVEAGNSICVRCIMPHISPARVGRTFIFPALFGLFGDMIGGPLSRQFGPGIRDVKVATGKWLGLADRLPSAHAMYWRNLSRNRRPVPPTQAVRNLIAALDLEVISPATRDIDSDDGAIE